MGSNTWDSSRICSFNKASNLLEWGAAGLVGVADDLLGEAPLETLVNGTKHTSSVGATIGDGSLIDWGVWVVW